MKSLKKPNFFVNTRKGAVYQLTPFYQSQYINNVAISYGDFLLMEQTLKQLKDNNLTFKKYLGYKDQLVYLSPLDYYKTKQCIKGKNQKNAVSMMGVNGYRDVTIEQYTEMCKIMDPNIVVQLTEVSAGTGKGSATRAVEKGIEFLDHMIEKISEHNANRSKEQHRISVYGSIQGGEYEDLRESAVLNVCARDVEGAVIHGLCQGESLEKRTQIYDIINKNIPEEKQDLLNMVLSSFGSPVDILHALQNNIQYFEIEYPFKMAELGFGLNFQKIELDVKTEAKKDKIENEKFTGLKANYFDLRDEKYAKSMHGLVEGCQCYTCQNHTMGYINHLLKCNELTAHVLLTIHNIHTYNQWFQEMQEAVQQGLLINYIEEFLKVNCSQGDAPVQYKLETPEETKQKQQQQSKPKEKRKARDLQKGQQPEQQQQGIEQETQN